MSKNATDKMGFKGIPVLVYVLAVIFCISGAVYLFTNGTGSTTWPKKAGLGVKINDMIATSGINAPVSEKGNFNNIEIQTFSEVNLLRREYKRNNDDLSVRVPGGEIVTRRSYNGNIWSIGPSRMDMSSSGKSTLKFSKKGEKVAGIELDGVPYSKVDEKTWRYGKQNKMSKLGSKYRWENKSKDFREFDESGRITSYGAASGTLAKLLYEPGQGGKVSGIADRKGNQVIWYEYNKKGMVTAVKDRANRRVEYSYTKDSLLSSVKDVMGNKTSYEYDKLGRLVKTTEPNGRKSIVTYDSNGDIASNVDGNGVGFFFEFDYDDNADEYYARIEHTSGRVREVWYDSNGVIKRLDKNGRTVKTVKKDGNDLIITENGYETREVYDDMDNLIKKIQPDGSEVSYEYDKEFNKVSRQTDEAGVAIDYKYDNKGQVTKKIEASGTKVERATEYTYDEDGNVISEKRLGDENTAETIKTFTYDEYGNKTSVAGLKGNKSLYSYDIAGNVKAITNAKGKVWTYEYDAMGRVVSSSDPQGNAIKTFYDAAGNVTREIDSMGRETAFQYDGNGNLVKKADAFGSTTLYEYGNACGKISRMTDPEGRDVHYTYDSECRLIKTTDGNGADIIFEYSDGDDCSTCAGSNSGQLSKIIYPTYTKEISHDSRGRISEVRNILSDTESYVTKYEYDSRGNTIEDIDNNGKTTTYEYDELNRKTKVIDPQNGVTTNTYDSRNNLISLTDANKNTTRFEYDINNDRVKEILPMGEETTYSYDNMGILTQKTDTMGQKTEYQRNDNGELEEVRYYNTVDYVKPIKVVSYTYDKAGNLKSYNDGITSASYEYNEKNMKTSETINYGPFSKKNIYAYYKSGKKSSFTGPDGITYNYNYDINDHLTGVKMPNNGMVSFSDYIQNRPKTVNLPGGVIKEYTYDPLMRIETIKSKASGGNGSGRGNSKDALMDYQYRYEAMNNITTKQTEHGDYKYGYDDLYRLTNVESPMPKAETFTYDAVGNRLTSAETTGQWSYNSNNELLATDNIQYSYDANGNMIQKTVDGTVTNYIYDVENHLSEVRGGSGNLIASYYYDPFGRRLWKEVDGIRTYFHYADEGLIGEYDENGTEIKTYGYKPGSTWTTDPLFIKEKGKYYYYHNDHLGTPQKMTTGNGTIVWSAKYSSFGEANIQVNTIFNNLRFPGQYYDKETGLYYNHYRYYDPKIGRYLRTDPIGLSGGINLYLYAVANPIKYFDPDGRDISPDSSVESAAVPFVDNITLSSTERTNYIGLVPGTTNTQLNNLVGSSTSEYFTVKSGNDCAIACMTGIHEVTVNPTVLHYAAVYGDAGGAYIQTVIKHEIVHYLRVANYVVYDPNTGGQALDDDTHANYSINGHCYGEEFENLTYGSYITGSYSAFLDYYNNHNCP